ncbi:hypothetical protein [Luteimonas salinilitoris]|uniref:DUF2946 domain-containing protein n=1 Tax=Luteimonas salinilitoris TaxID=3237697 RepID=A0ABV4HTA0_9GAMM
MVRFRRRRWLPLLRVLVLVLFALGSVLQPVMAAAGEMHELAHDASGMHAHDLHADEVDAAGEQGQDETRILNVLLHFAHCCGATAALLPALGSIPAMPAPGGLAIAKAPIPPQVRLASPFKPPIFG